MRYRLLFIVTLLSASCGDAVASGAIVIHNERQQVERNVVADPRVVLSVCVVSGSLTIQSWDRLEVHVRASDGPQIELRRGDVSKSESATELKLMTQDPRSSRGGSCVVYGNLELNVPREAVLRLQTSEADIKVTSVARVTARSQSGRVTIAGAKDRVDVSTISGDISIKESAGPIRVHSVSGSVEARSVGPAAAEDVFEASTVSGDFTLAGIRHLRMRTNTVEGSISYSGPLVKGGHYSFQSISGGLNLSLPPDASFRVSGTLSRGSDFISDFPLPTSDTPMPAGVSRSVAGIRRIEGVIGSGDAIIVISSFSGSVKLRRQ